MRRLLALGLAALLPASCTHRAPPPGAEAHYVLGPPYQAGGIWRYPHEQYDATLTGLATVYAGPRPRLTADGEAFDPAAMAVAHPTLQLPAMARLTDLETGRQVTVRVNDRGPAAVGRMLEVTPGVASRLGFPADGVARVRLDVLPAESHEAADDLPGAPRLVIASAPREAICASPLPQPLPQGEGRSTERVGAFFSPSPCGRGPGGGVAAATPPPAPPPSLSAQVTQTQADPGRLYVRLSRFTDRTYAARQAARFRALPAEVAPARGGAGYRAQLGPFATVGEADAALDRALRAGVTDARIVVE